MKLSVGIIGLPNVGKSTLFNALTGAGALVANYPFATIEANTGVAAIPDPRLDHLAELVGAEKKTPATVTFVDIAGLVEGASHGEGLGNRFLAKVRDVSALCHVVRAFDSPSVVRVTEAADPEGEIEIVETELVLADLESVERRLPKLEKEATADPRLRPAAELLRELEEVLALGEPVNRHRDLATRAAEVAELNLLTAKAVIYVFNGDEALLADGDRRSELAQAVAPAEAVFIDAGLEAELADLDPEDRAELLASVGQSEPGLNAVVRAAYRALGLQTFITVRGTETRAWTIPVGATAYEAAGAVHTDFQRGFIAAEVIEYATLAEVGSWQAARAKGLIRTEGRDYVMQPDDVVEFRFNL
ncbi:MAG TPA: redox-regulated ATPase YchF [Acidimicrobiia bacterium]|nr:redox-regulated ATPase YchF [Acidimicrobiia bacterium]